MKFISIFLVFNIFFNYSLKARIVERSDLKFEQLEQLIEFDIAADGTYSTIESNKIILTNEAAKELFSLHKIHYQSSRESLEVISAYVENDGKRVDVPLTSIEDKAVDGSSIGFDSSRTVSISFPALKVGSILYTKVKKNIKHIAVPGHFSFEGYLGSQSYEHNSNMVFKSKVPLYFDIKDPYKVLKVNEEKLPDGSFKVLISQKRPFMHFPIEEYSVMSKDELTLIRLSTDKDLNKIKKYLMTKFNEKIDGALTSEAQKWINETSNISNVAERVNRLVAKQVDYFNYVGDWRTVEGAYIPRDIKKIWETRQGDCKDFSIVLTQLLRNIGINANPALVKRSSFYENYQTFDDKTTFGILDFNHAIVNINIEGKDYWIDPTNSVSFGLNSREDISGKNALVLNSSEKSYLKIPMPISEKTKQWINKDYVFTSAEEADIKAELVMTGEAALLFTGLEKKITKNKVKEGLKKLIQNGESSGDVAFSDFDLSTSFFKDIRLSLEYKGVRLGTVIQNNRVLSLPDPLIAKTLALGTDKYIGDLILGLPQVVYRKTYYKGISAVGRFPESCNISTSWLEASRQYNLTDNGIEVVESIDVKTGIIKKEDFKKTDFKMLQLNFAQCFFGTTFSYVYGSGKHSTTSANLAILFKELPLSERLEKRKEIARLVKFAVGRKRVQAYNDQDVLALMKMNIQEDPKDDENYTLLSDAVLDMGYLNGSNWTSESIASSLQILSVGLQQVPESVIIPIRLASTLALSGQKDSAKKIFGEVQSKYHLTTYTHFTAAAYLARRLENLQLAIDYQKMAISKAVTDDEKSFATFNMAYIYSRNNDITNCIRYYKETTDIDPKYFWAHLNVINCYLDMKKVDEAVASGEKSYNLVPRGMSANNYGSALQARADQYIKEKKYDQALIDLKRSLEVAPKDINFLKLAKVHVAKKDLKLAEDTIESGTAYIEQNVQSYYIQAASILDYNPEKFILYINKAVDLSQSVADKMSLYFYIVNKMTGFGKYHEYKSVALESLKIGEAYLAEFPNDADTHLQVGRILLFLSSERDDVVQLELSENHIKKALEINKDNKMASSVLNNINTVNQNIGREPASFWWKAKAMTHEVLQKNFNYKLVEW